MNDVSLTFLHKHIECYEIGLLSENISNNA